MTEALDPIARLLESKGGDFRLCGNILLRRELPVGLVRPSILISTTSGKEISLVGTRGRVDLRADANEVTEALAAVGCLIPGDLKEIRKVQQLLLDPKTSRTTSYVLCLVNTCEELLSSMKRIHQATVTVVGCGGIGSLSSLLFSGAGISKIILVDGDIVSESNLNRQFSYSIDDIGKKKVDVLSKFILERFPQIDVVTCPYFVNEKNLEKVLTFSSCSLYTADEPIGLVRMIRRLKLKPWPIIVAAGYSFERALVEIIQPCDSPVTTENWTRLENSVMPSYGPANSEISGVATSLLLCLVAGLGNKYVTESRATWNSIVFPPR